MCGDRPPCSFVFCPFFLLLLSPTSRLCAPGTGRRPLLSPAALLLLRLPRRNKHTLSSDQHAAQLSQSVEIPGDTLESQDWAWRIIRMQQKEGFNQTLSEGAMLISQKCSTSNRAAHPLSLLELHPRSIYSSTMHTSPCPRFHPVEPPRKSISSWLLGN